MAAALLSLLRWAFVVLAALLSVGADAQNSQCPTECSCQGFLVDCSNRRLRHIPTRLPSWVQILELQSNQISTIPEDAFSGLDNLQQLDLSNNQLRILNASVFRDLKGLRELKIDHNHLTEFLNVGAFSPNLTVLSLQHNQISSLPAGVLSNFTSLRQLYLSHNKISSILPGTFPSGLPLYTLDLNNNKISGLTKGCFDNLTNLETLRLNKNRISRIPPKMFKLPSLKSLELNRNRIKKIEGLSFHGLESLQVLRLRRNHISTLMDGSFWGLSNIQHLQMDGNNLTSITKGWLYGLSKLQQLTLSRNAIRNIESEGWEFCQELWHLDLSHNQLIAIENGAFSRLSKLQLLDLSNNKICDIAEGAFHGLSSLQTLELKSNEISWAIEDMNGAFSGLRALNKLNLDRNHIKSIAKRAFSGLDGLRKLDLTDNDISSIQPDAFAGLKLLEELRMNSSNLICDCQLKWLPRFLKESGFGNTVDAKCSHPEELRGINILQVKDFTCDDQPKPTITTHPKTTTALRGDNVTLLCAVTSIAASPMHFAWKHDNKVIDNADIENYATMSDGNIVMEYTSILKLWNVDDSTEGRYQCVISNHFGPLYSNKAKLTVHVFPKFTNPPQDFTARADGTAKLQCAAIGQPAPQIAWQKDGGTDFPAARERRMHMMPEDDFFFIVKVKTSDMGVYTCTATNDAGTITANATLTVLETPTFVRPLEDTETMEGETTVLECLAAGSPQPSVSWKKDGDEVPKTNRHFLTASNQLLIIMHTEPGDAGRYECEMSNTVGTKRESASLTVVPGVNPTQVLASEGVAQESTTTGIIIISVVCCVVGTSLVWVIIIYRTRGNKEEYSQTNTDETNLPPDMPGSNFRLSQEGVDGGGQDPAAQHGHQPPHPGPQRLQHPSATNSLGRRVDGGNEAVSVEVPCSRYPPRLRSAAIFPSDAPETQLSPLTQHEQALAEHSGNSITSIPLPEDVANSQGDVNQNTTHSPLRTFRPIHSPNGDENAPQLEKSVERYHHPSGSSGSSSSPEERRRHHHRSRDRLVPDLYHRAEPPGSDDMDVESEAQTYSSSLSSNSSQGLPRFPKDVQSEFNPPPSPLTRSRSSPIAAVAPSHHSPVYRYPYQQHSSSSQSQYNNPTEAFPSSKSLILTMNNHRIGRDVTL
ncbi:leucine-rich repeats and immunoglobulin-like domains protein 3 isoform X1 [Branchiostoma floridae]|uniref:Leucine-rich repeats and immunoglobulin-like domains protein 3 isoform X1 n=1 Tax=Branchiostoma floridae TaxID=7739 RepID=A0A9J7MR73_BRAFL|nr:leucine-rich repeats and immunoglobulin-like domains protein 3 isoform X1 [Branchiostoma floridae]